MGQWRSVMANHLFENRKKYLNRDNIKMLKQSFHDQKKEKEQATI